MRLFVFSVEQWIFLLSLEYWLLTNFMEFGIAKHWRFFLTPLSTLSFRVFVIKKKKKRTRQLLRTKIFRQLWCNKGFGFLRWVYFAAICQRLFFKLLCLFRRMLILLFCIFVSILIKYIPKSIQCVFYVVLADI